MKLRLRNEKNWVLCEIGCCAFPKRTLGTSENLTSLLCFILLGVARSQRGRWERVKNRLVLRDYVTGICFIKIIHNSEFIIQSFILSFLRVSRRGLWSRFWVLLWLHSF